MQRLEGATTNEIFKIGLHEFITTFVQDNDKLGNRSPSNICSISERFRAALARRDRKVYISRHSIFS